MTVAFIGHGYVGLVTAAVFADLGNTVWVVGRTKEKIEKLQRGIAPFYEPGLSELVARNVAAKRLLFTLDYAEAVGPSEIVFICVGTPPKDNGEADLSSVFAAAEEIGKHLFGYKIIVTKSTVPPGTGKEVVAIINKQKPSGASFAYASVPEFLREGTAIDDTLHPDRVVIGTSSDRAQEILLEFHKPINSKAVPRNTETAERIKYASNAMLSTKISFANAVALVAEKVDADVEKVLDGVGLDRRIGRSFLYPGVGYGGSCFPKDVKALIAIAKSKGYDFQLLSAVDEINKQMKLHFVGKVMQHFKGNIKGKALGVLGLAFKPNTDDMREAPSIKILTELVKYGAKIVAYDPVAMDNAKGLLPKSVRFVKSAHEAAKGADALLVLTEWNEFRQIDLVRLAKGMRNLVLFDGRNVYDPVAVKKLGFMYYGIGRV